MYRPSVLAAGFVALAMAGPGSAARAASPLQLELNKVEPVDGGCRLYLVLRNEGETFDSLKLDLVGFGTDGVIRQRVAVELGPVPAARTTVRLFDLAGADCPGLGSLLVNDVLTCSDSAGAVADCVDRLAVSSRATATLTK